MSSRLSYAFQWGCNTSYRTQAVYYSINCFLCDKSIWKHLPRYPMLSSNFTRLVAFKYSCMHCFSYQISSACYDLIYMRTCVHVTHKHTVYIRTHTLCLRTWKYIPSSLSNLSLISCGTSWREGHRQHNKLDKQIKKGDGSTQDVMYRINTRNRLYWPHYTVHLDSLPLQTLPLASWKETCSLIGCCSRQEFDLKMLYKQDKIC